MIARLPKVTTRSRGYWAVEIKPELSDAMEYGQVGQTIRIKAKDDTKVASVRVVIHNNGTILEEGDAVPAEDNVLLWSYVTTTIVTRTPELLLDANAYDLPGNFGAMSVPMN